MDTSEVYIKMCKKAKEIQNGISHPLNFDLEYIQTEDDLVWLPRQDQLQEMMANWNTPAEMFINGIPALTESDDYFSSQDESERNYYRTFHSWEQLWLAFVMKKKYGKVWDGNEWKRLDKVK